MSEINEVENAQDTRESILDMAMGAIKERADYEMSKIIDNIQDINVQAEKKRTMTIQIDFEPDITRNKMTVSAAVKSKLAPTAPVSTMLYAAPDSNGEIAYKEMGTQAPGQMDVYGGAQPEPAILKLVR
jgi:hypothetical protein